MSQLLYLCTQADTDVCVEASVAFATCGRMSAYTQRVHMNESVRQTDRRNGKHLG